MPRARSCSTSRLVFAPLLSRCFFASRARCVPSCARRSRTASACAAVGQCFSANCSTSAVGNPAMLASSLMRQALRMASALASMAQLTARSFPLRPGPHGLDRSEAAMPGLDRPILRRRIRRRDDFRSGPGANVGIPSNSHGYHWDPDRVSLGVRREHRLPLQASPRASAWRAARQCGFHRQGGNLSHPPSAPLPKVAKGGFGSFDSAWAKGMRIDLPPRARRVVQSTYPRRAPAVRP